jgi:hypothetical protein
VESIPPEFRHPEFRYSFKVVNARDINAFALPGGYTYVNRGLIEAANTEGQLAGVMAHEISHVALRHGTAQAAKAGKYQVGSTLGQILGAVIGGGVGGVVGAASQIGFGAAFLKYGRDYERQADTLGAQIMANAGYDPRELAEMFRIIERQGGSGGPEWLSSHPNPGNRYEAINREAAMLRIQNPVEDTQEFRRVRASLREMSAAPTNEEIARGRGRRYPTGSGRAPRGRVEYPSDRFRQYNGGNLYSVGVPENWQPLGENNNNLTFAPEGAYGDVQGRFVFTHGAMVGVAPTQSNNLRQATDNFINQLAQENRSLRLQGGYQRGTIDRRNALAMTLSNVSEATGRPEIVTVYTTLLGNGELFYMIGVVPQDEYRNYEQVFQAMVRSIRLNY